MIDLETLGVSRDTIILEAALVVFDKEGVLEQRIFNMDIKEQVQERTIDSSTVAWWIKTDKLKLGKLISSGCSLLKDLVDSLNYLYKIHKVERVWSRGSFDLQIIRSLGPVPWTYWMERDVRTLDELRKMPKNTSHSALDDCLNQIEFVRSILW
jgi:hypothetical protein